MVGNGEECCFFVLCLFVCVFRFYSNQIELVIKIGCEILKWGSFLYVYV
jgi:hypothetical protein